MQTKSAGLGVQLPLEAQVAVFCPSGISPSSQEKVNNDPSIELVKPPMEPFMGGRGGPRQLTEKVKQILDNAQLSKYECHP